MRASAARQTSTAEAVPATIVVPNLASGRERRHPMTRGTRKRPASGAASGALASASLDVERRLAVRRRARRRAH